MKLRIGVGVLLLLATLAPSTQKQARVTGFFSDMQYIPEAGDVVGAEVWIVYGGDHYYATIQLAEGVPFPPVVVPVDVSGSTVKFAVPDQGVNADGIPAPLNFEGIVTPTGLVGKVGSQKLNLKRRSSYWQ
jgi:hypothetical protein